MKAQKKPCGQCPFLFRSVRGWLGPWKAEDIVSHVLGEQPWVCHRTITSTQSETELVEGNLVCAGSLQCATASAKTYRPGELLDLQKEAGHNGEVMSVFQFLEYHKSRLPLPAETDDQPIEAKSDAGRTRGR